MAVTDLYSSRQKALRGELVDIYQYDNFSFSLKNQFIHIIKDLDSIYHKSYDAHIDKFYRCIHGILCREYGKLKLVDRKVGNQRAVDIMHDMHKFQLHDFIRNSIDHEEVLDVIELSFRFCQEHCHSPEKINLLIDELNERFKRAGIGYSFENNQIIRIDSTYVHSEITKPVLSLLSNQKFEGAFDEYLKAHEHYRHGRNKESLIESLKSFESVMKTICDEKGWAYDKEKDVAKKLINICLIKGLLPNYLETQLASFRGLFESGIPTIRNKNAGHGQGTEVQLVEDEMARYCLNLTGTNIIFLIEKSGIK